MTNDLHPRPQLTREHWTDLCGVWQFAYDDQDVGLDNGWVNTPAVFERTIQVPFPPESRASGIGDTTPHPVVWYRRTIQLPVRDRPARLLLHFGAVDYEAQVWVNGHLVATHQGGHTPFAADITHALHAHQAEQAIVVCAKDQPTDLSQPRGKQYWEPEPRAIWYHRTTGIWQPVWLEPVGATYITDVRWTPNLDQGLVGVQVQLNMQPDHRLSLRLQLFLRDVLLMDDTYTVQRSEIRRDIALEATDLTMSQDRLLWSPDAPNIIDAVLTLSDGEKIIDQVRSYVGVRSIGFADGRFLLNGRPYYLRLVLEQGYWPESHLAAPSGDALRHEVEQIKALGFNGVRIHQKVEDPRFLYWCDKLGLLVWGEMANAYVFSSQAIERLTREWMEVLKRDYSHPCIVIWVPLNESWGVPALDRDPAQQHYMEMLYHLTHALDPTRPVIGNDGWEHLVSDVLSIHDYTLNGATLRERYGTPEALERTLRSIQPANRPLLLPGSHRSGQPVMLTEWGGISYAPHPGQSWYGYGAVSDAGALLAKYTELIEAILDCPTIAGFCYTQLADTEQETNGLLLADRTSKLDMRAVYALTTRPSRAIPTEIISSMQAAAQVTVFQASGN